MTSQQPFLGHEVRDPGTQKFLCTHAEAFNPLVSFSEMTLPKVSRKQPVLQRQLGPAIDSGVRGKAIPLAKQNSQIDVRLDRARRNRRTRNPHKIRKTQFNRMMAKTSEILKKDVARRGGVTAVEPGDEGGDALAISLSLKVIPTFQGEGAASKGHGNGQVNPGEGSSSQGRTGEAFLVNQRARSTSKWAEPAGLGLGHGQGRLFAQQVGAPGHSSVQKAAIFAQPPHDRLTESLLKVRNANRSQRHLLQQVLRKNDHLLALNAGRVDPLAMPPVIGRRTGKKKLQAGVHDGANTRYELTD